MRNPLFLDLGREKHNDLQRITFPVILALTLVITFTYSPGEDASSADPWDVAMEAYPDGSMACHAAVVDRMLRMSDVLDDSPYTASDSSLYASDDPDDLALRMAIDGDIRPPECDGIGGGKAP